MNDQERFCCAVLGGRPDRIPLLPTMGSPRKATLRRWYNEGFPRDVYWAEYLGFDHHEHVFVDTEPVPRFEEKIIEEKGDYKIWIDELGAKRMDFKKDAAPGFVTRSWLEFPVKNRHGFIEIKKRFNPQSPMRYPEYWNTIAKKYQDRDFVAGVIVPFMFWKARDWMGLEGLCEAFYDQPAFVHEMMEFITDFSISVLERVLSDAGPDYIFISEDMAYKHASMISPDMIRKFMFKHYRRFMEFIRSRGVKIVIMDCDGFIEELIPLWIELGIDAVWPVEVAAGNDPHRIRREYGNQIALIGTIDKRALAQDKNAIKNEVMSKVPKLWEEGRFVPTVDHGTPHDVPYENFLYYVELLRDIGGK